eukprot:scaffold36031_cov63-Phaeocystis_antarctica.AAC.1
MGHGSRLVSVIGACSRSRRGRQRVRPLAHSSRACMRTARMCWKVVSRLISPLKLRWRRLLRSTCRGRGGKWCGRGEWFWSGVGVGLKR